MSNPSPHHLTPVDHPSAWRAAEFAGNALPVVHLSGDEAATLRGAVAAVRDTPAERIIHESFGLEAIQPTVARIRNEVLHGRGVVIVRGFPVEDCSQPDIERMFYGLGTHLGEAVSQSRMGDRIGHVVDVSRDNPNERGYRSRRELSLHTDSDNVVMMLCIRAATSGGFNRFSSSLNVYNQMLESCPELVPALVEGFQYHWRGEEPDGEPPVTDYKVPVFSTRDGVTSCVFLREFITMAAEEIGRPLSAVQQRALARFQQLAEDPANVFEYRLSPGEAFLINNFTVLHSRTAFEDDATPGKGRHLLRLWLKNPDARPLVEAVQRYYGVDGIQPREGAGTLYTPQSPAQ